MIYKRYANKCQQINLFLSKDTFIKCLIIRILPLGSNFLTNIVAGTLRIPLAPFVLGSGIGFIPQVLLFTAIGSGLAFSEHTQQQIMLVSCAAALLLTATLFVSAKNKNASSQAGT